MIIRGLIALLALGAILAVLPASTKPVSQAPMEHDLSCCKPSPPVDIDLKIVGRTDPGTRFGLIVTIAPHQAGTYTAEVVLPDGMVHVAGEKSFEFPFRDGQSRELRLDLLVPDKDRREILVKVVCRPDGKTKLASCRSIVVHDAPIASGGVKKITKDGTGILEFKQQKKK